MKKVVLCIMDGVGFRQEEYGNAVKQANTPNLDKLLEKYPHSLLEASGNKVGLPAGQMGNSEVGHTNIGAGRVVKQPLQIINDSISDKTFYQNKELISAIKYAKDNNSKLHLLGLVSDGGIHSHINHLLELLSLCKQEEFENVYLHLFTDGRDTAVDSSYSFISQVESKIKELGIGQIASIGGRYYAMDRDNNWDRIDQAYDAIVSGNASRVSNIEQYIKESYEKGVTDEFLKPVITAEGGLIEENDSIITFNFRPDRIREILTVITNPFDHYKKINNLKLVTMMSVSDEVKCTNAFEATNLENILGIYLSNLKLNQLRIAETEKYAHVTYFFDGGKDIELPGCKRILVPSSKVATYDLKPEMSAYEITDKLLIELDKNIYDLVVVNFANGDMVGHTGNMIATIKAVEVVDEVIGKIAQKVEEMDSILVVTADHGNSDYMLDSNGSVVTSHSTSLVPFIITDSKYKLKDGKLADIAPTILTIMGIDIPVEMTGEVLIEK